MDLLDFIKDKKLRGNIEDSLEYMFLLFKESSIEGKSEIYKEETNRVIVLYVISVIEALFLYFYKQIPENDIFYKYETLQNLKSKVVAIDGDGDVVLAIKKSFEKSDYDLTLGTLVKFFEKIGKVKKTTRDRILDLNSLRNTFHLSKERGSRCDTETAENALDLLFYVITNISKHLG